MATILPIDTELRFPDFTVISASAGSGKTHTLTLKLLQLLLSQKIPNNKLNNVLAMTFTKNAAAEMRQRVLEYLKKAYLGDRKVIGWLSDTVTMDEEQLRTRCGELIEMILQDYSAFQVQTIDSFMARIFRASALEFGFSPALEIKTDNRELLDNAFEQFARNLAIDPAKRELLDQLVDVLIKDTHTSSRYIWNPFNKLTHEVRHLYGVLSAQAKEIQILENENRSSTMLRSEILDIFKQLHTLVKKSGLTISNHFEAAIESAESGDVDGLIERKSLYNLPVKKSGEGKQLVEEWNARFSPIQKKLKELASEYIVQQAYNYYRPYIKAYSILRSDIEQTMRRSGQISLSDVNRLLLNYISEETVPQVYYYLGDSVFHYLIDEFQDTSPVQWETLKPLFAEALSKQGSLFVVGDTKQSIYAFRYADWRIMKNVMEAIVFPSAPPDVKELETNYRSYERILDFSKEIFHEIVSQKMEGEAPHASGLSKFKQEVKESNKKKGYVEVVSFEKNEEQELERFKILEIVNDCVRRGYNYNDITILTPKNEHVIAISSWLNSAKIKFISHSSLDIRGQSITSEILALLRFLDSPIDDLSFAAFLLSGAFHRLLDSDNVKLKKEEIHAFLLDARTNRQSLYISFRKQYANLWKKYFEKPFAVVGYLPMYDLLSDICKQFRLFELAPYEQATLIKLLEVVKDFEESGQNTLKNFLNFAGYEDDTAEWNIAAPRSEDAVSVMTIHKAKGLDNRVVIVLLVDSKPKTENLFIEECEDGIRLVRITQKSANQDSALHEMYVKHQLEKEVDDLNKLYVAFTRAKEEMYIVSIRNPKEGKPSIFLPQTGYEPSAKPAVNKADKPAGLIAELYHSSKEMPAEIISPERLAFYERTRGEVIHEILSRIEYADENIEKNISLAIKEILGDRLEPAKIVSMKSSMLEFLQMPELQTYFTAAEGRAVLNEQEFVSPEGRLVRMDRIIVDANNVTVIDFKTGDDKEDYTKQVRDYMAVLQNCYPNRIIGGVLAFVDRKKLRIIK